MKNRIEDSIKQQGYWSAKKSFENLNSWHVALQTQIYFLEKCCIALEERIQSLETHTLKPHEIDRADAEFRKKIQDDL